MAELSSAHYALTPMSRMPDPGRVQSRRGAANIGHRSRAAMRRGSAGVDRIAGRTLCVGGRRASCRIPRWLEAPLGRALPRTQVSLRVVERVAVHTVRILSGSDGAAVAWFSSVARLPTFSPSASKDFGSQSGGPSVPPAYVSATE